MENWGSAGIIYHDGIVQKANKESVTVLITASTACSKCNIGGSCSLAEASEKKIIIPGNYKVRSGDSVTILMKQSLGFTAVLFGYILPFITVILTLIIMYGLGFSELISGISSLTILVPYFIMLYVLRKEINKKFTLSLKVSQ